MKLAAFFTFLFMGAFQSYSQTIDCANKAVLKITLKALRDSDQQVRLILNQRMQTLKMPQDSAIYMPLVRDMKKQDKKNQQYISALLDKCGWPDSLTVIENNTIFLVIDHAESEYISKYLPLLSQKAKEGVVQKSDYATLSDRLLMYKGKKQIYGTQSYQDKFSHLTTIWPVENAEKLDELRKGMLLPTMKQYMENLKSAFGTEVVWNTSITVEEAQKSFKKTK